MASMKSGRWLIVRMMSGTLPAIERERTAAKALCGRTVRFVVLDP